MAKLRPFGIDVNSCMLIESYVRKRKQIFKISNMKSNLLYIVKADAEDSIFEPFTYNVN